MLLNSILTEKNWELSRLLLQCKVIQPVPQSISYTDISLRIHQNFVMALRNLAHKTAQIARKYSTKQRNFKEITIPVAWGHLSGKWWEPYDKRPILALHGWQDSCGSFDRLIPLLNEEIGVLAIDRPGHGLSSRLPPGAYYHDMNYPLLISQIAAHFRWPKISLMGHSMGAIMSYTYTMLLPNTVDFCVCIDGLKPLQRKGNIGPRMGAGLQSQLKYDRQASDPAEPPSYPLDEIKKKLCAINDNSIDIRYVHHILDRNVKPSQKNPGQYCLTRDPRLKARLYFNWPYQDVLDGARQVTTPLIMFKFHSGYFGDSKEKLETVIDVLRRVSKDLRYYEIEGSHHTHLNTPETISELINDFVRKHCEEDRTIGGLVAS